MIKFLLSCIECGENLIFETEKDNIGRVKITCTHCKEGNIYNLNFLSGQEVENAKYNIVVLGKTGVGKSSLINYLYGEDVREVGSGKPVTGKGFEKIEIKLNGLETKIFDSWGIEAGKANDWSRILDKELKKRDIFSDVKDWFHTVFYCISAGGARVEDFEINLINKFIAAKYKVNIIFTKADLATEEEIEKLKTVLNKSLKAKVSMIAVCNEEKELLGGNKIEPFGKKEVEQAIVEGFWDSIVMRTPRRCTRILIRKLNNWYGKQKRYIEKEFGFLSQKKVAKKINDEIEEFIDKLDKEIVGRVIFKELKEIIDVYSQISRSYFRSIKQKKIIPSYQELLKHLKESEDEDVNALAAILEGAVIAGGGALAAKGLGALLLFKMTLLGPVAIAGLLIALGKTKKKKKKLKKNLREIRNKIENNLKEMEPKLEKMFAKIKEYEYQGIQGG
ncbi:GTPase [Natroniella sp. ANB-PHB2]|uniref:GTPase n=1 Tax=Natroniella sp. ANB-PHB2 TaxID=3384444 RepID=UPI0038D448FF